MILDISTWVSDNNYIPIPGPNRSSDRICVTQTSNMLLYGHRNGNISMSDIRCQDCWNLPSSYAEKSKSLSFGYVSSLLTQDDNIVVSRGSSGNCNVYDIRRNGLSSLLWKLQLPRDENVPMKSSFCSGLAFDPMGKVAITPFVATDSKTRFGMWSLTNGRFISSVDGLNSSGPPVNQPFCELSSTITQAWEIKQIYGTSNEPRYECQRGRGQWGLWFKSNDVPPDVTLQAGGINHITFPGGDFEPHQI